MLCQEKNKSAFIDFRKNYLVLFPRPILGTELCSSKPLL